MNLLIFSPEELQAGHPIRLTGRRHDHLRKILRASPGDQFRAGVLNGSLGQAEVLALADDHSLLAFHPNPDLRPPAPLAGHLIMALPRPPVLRRSLQTAAALGFKNIHLIHTERVEKSYWQSPELAAKKMQEQLLLGLEQCVDVVLPQIQLHRRFRPFAEDLLPKLQKDWPSILADPRGKETCPRMNQTPCNLLIGPEGGWIPFELDLLEGLGVRLVHLGQRILRVETALPYMAGCLGLGANPD